MILNKLIEPCFIFVANYELNQSTSSELKPLHRLLYKRDGKVIGSSHSAKYVHFCSQWVPRLRLSHGSSFLVCWQLIMLLVIVMWASGVTQFGALKFKN